MRHNPFSLPRHIPKGVKTLTLATSIRYFGWGLGKAMIPVFLYQFAHSYAETGLVSSTYSIGFLLTVPLLGLLQDHISARQSLVSGLWFYPLVGIGYLLTGLTGAVVFLVLARFFNGIGFALYSIGASTYIKRNTPADHVAANTGFFKSVTIWAWVAAVAVGIPLLRFVPVHWLLFAIVPTHIAALFVIRRLNHDAASEKTFSLVGIAKSYAAHVREKIAHHRHHAVRTHKLGHRGLKLMVASTFVINLAWAINGFLLPLFVFQRNQDVLEVALMAIVTSIPAMLVVFFGQSVDRNPVRSLVLSFALLCPIVAGLGAATGYAFTLGLAFSMGVMLEIIGIAVESVTTAVTPESHYGSATVLISAVDDFGDLVGPILLGVGMDLVGIRYSLFGLALFLALFFIAVLASRSRLRAEMVPVPVEA
jgi:MFS family permease